MLPTAGSLEPGARPRQVVVLGAGIAGLLFARALSGDPAISVRLFEADEQVGGLARSFTVDGFTFDYGIHGLYTKNPDVATTFDEWGGTDHQVLEVQVRDSYDRRWLKHPLHLNLRGLAPELIVKCLLGFIQVAAQAGQNPKPKNYAEWCYANLGEFYSEEFQFPYTRKFWAAEPEELTTEWMGPRVPAPNIKQIIEGVAYKVAPTKHYVTQLRYPKRGGFGFYARKLARGLTLQTNYKAVVVDTGTKSVSFSNGTEVHYDALVSTLPLPALVSLIRNAPDAVTRAASHLETTSLALVSIGVNRENALKFHWAYGYDRRLRFARLSAPSLWSVNHAPRGTSSIQAEVYYRGSPPDTEETVSEVLRNLREIGTLRRTDKILALDYRTIPKANVIYTHNREAAVRTIHKFLDERRIIAIGRYSNWDYSLIDQTVSEIAKSSKYLVEQL